MSKYKSKNFWIFRNGKPYQNNYYLLNPVGKYVFSVLNYLYTSKNLPFLDELDNIIVTSQYRNVGRHATNKAIDITCIPIKLLPVIWIVLHQYTNLNVLLSLHDRHIHIDYIKDMQPTINANFKGLEIIAQTKTKEGNLQFYFKRPTKEYFTQVVELYNLDKDNKVYNFVEKYFTEYRSEQNKLKTNVKMTSLYFEQAKETTKQLAKDVVKSVDTTIILSLFLISAYYLYNLYKKGE